MKPICVKCGREHKVVEIGVPYEECFSDGSPYKLWMTDLLECPVCRAQILIRGEGQRPIAEHYQENYAVLRERHPPTIIGAA